MIRKAVALVVMRVMLFGTDGQVITKEIPFAVENGIYSGEARFRIGIKSVPYGIEIVCE